jgi:hypothetical protein
MLGFCRNHKDYTTFVLTELKALAETRPDQIEEYREAVMKMLILDLDPLIPVITPLYPPIGRPAEMQPEIFRSFVLMEHMRMPLNNWVEKLSLNPVLRAIAGFTADNMPKTSSYYDFINRVVPLKEHSELRPVKIKPKGKLKKGEKLPPKNPGVVADLVKQVLSDEKRFLKRLSRRPERFLQKIFARVAVDASTSMGLIPDSASVSVSASVSGSVSASGSVPASVSVSVSGDGTCIETGASPYGQKVCKCKDKGIYKCACDRKFSDPNATWGWDSHNERYFYGYTGYFISTYNRDLKLDLPLYLRLVQANRHDSVSAVFALNEFRELNPNLTIDTFISDSASDNYATYELLNHWGVNAVIALNGKSRGNFKYPPALRIDDNGVPICQRGFKMVYNGYCKSRSRLKWRCCRSFYHDGLNAFPPCEGCSKSPYGRVVYTKPDWDLRLFTRIPRGSKAWKSKMKERTAAERVNDRILNDYGVEDGHVRGKKRISFMVTLAAVNIHLDAQVKVLISQGALNLNQIIPGAAAA